MTYRTAENEILDIRSEEVRGFIGANYPAIMADRPTGMSDAYQFMPSYKIAEALTEKFGLGLVAVGQQFSRKRNPAGQEHFMRFRLPTSIKLQNVGDSLPELVITNSHNGRSTLKAYAGVFRLVCSNGMVVADKTFGHIKLRHFGHDNNFESFSNVLDGMAVNFDRMDRRMKILDELAMTPGQQIGLARAMMKARGVPAWVEPHMVLQGRRDIEQVDSEGLRSVWKTYNVAQESLAEARDVQFVRDGARSRSLRPLVGARAQVLVNERLWGAMEDFVAANWPELASEVIDGTAQEVAEAPAVSVVAEDHGQEEESQERHVLRSADELLSLDYDNLITVSDEELNALSKDEKVRFSKRKSYLKKKAGL